MPTDKKSDIELAAALFYALGEPVEHDFLLEKKALQLKEQIKDRERLLLKIIELCGDPRTPRQYYLCAKAYSWLGKSYCGQVIHYANEYLNTDGWNSSPNNVKEENGIRINRADSRRGEIYMVLASALESAGNAEEAYSDYSEAYYLEPYNAMAVIKAADVLVKLRGRAEALEFLLQQKQSEYYKPVKYRDALGNIRCNDLFKQLLDAHILKLSGKGDTNLTEVPSI